MKMQMQMEMGMGMEMEEECCWREKRIRLQPVSGLLLRRRRMRSKGDQGIRGEEGVDSGGWQEWGSNYATYFGRVE